MRTRRLRTFVLLCGSLLPLVSAAATEEASAACDYYAAPVGGGNGQSQASPFTIADFWAVAAPGKTLCLLDGTYTGSGSMIDPPDDLKGSATAPITVRALNDGRVLIDGEGARRPIVLYRNDWFVIEGINACRSSVDDAVVGLDEAHHNVIRRVIAWDAGDTNTAVIGIHSSTFNLLEDVAAFGIGRKVISGSQGGDYSICRRCWARWEGSTNVGPKMAFETAYNTYGWLFENSIGTWDAGSMPASYILQNNGEVWTGEGAGTYTSVQNPWGVFSAGGYTTRPPNPNLKILGSIAYIGAGDVSSGSLFFLATWPDWDGVVVERSVAYAEPGRFPGTKSFFLASDGSGKNLFAHRLTAIGGAGNDIYGGWITNDTEWGATLADVSSIYDAAVGAGICQRTVNGAVTSEPLWPWPMNQRILDATTLAASPDHQHTIYLGNPPTPTLVTDPHAPLDVTATIERLLGPIPAPCKSRSIGVPGDLDGNGKRDLADVRLLIYMLLGQQAKTPEADLTGDGAVTLADLQALIKLLVGL